MDRMLVGQSGGSADGRLLRRRPIVGPRARLAWCESRSRVVDGRVVVEGEPLAEGTAVTVLSGDDEDGFDLDPDAERELLAALDEARQDDGVEHSSRGRTPSLVG